MNMVRQCLSVGLGLMISATAFAANKSPDWNQWLFHKLVDHPQFEATLYTEKALILRRDDNFYAAFAVVQSETSSFLCAYAAAFDSLIGNEPGAYTFKPRYICDDASRLSPYDGLFVVKYPGCGAEICANPAIGVGNLDILPDSNFSLDRLPIRLPVKVDARIRFDPSLPIAGGS
ncbi:MAG TPA: hypothetical protein VE954_13845 [Oligoflexus sp.]|uniref:hypothetical protein n=1 Tax=Oligoflexus sp. TaxID=1971216 RepID=UPI002D689C48|nr:hypothetical protein [Oligoflexus sp.]HYX34182.1 hypothetical protein [Oligoflexus sp.]